MRKLTYFKCPVCDKRYNEIGVFENHMRTFHPGTIPEDFSILRFVYYLITGRTSGSCIVCKKETEWNEATGKYKRYCGSVKCKQNYINTVNGRKIGKFGKINLLDDPDMQRKMLANRKIAKKYASKQDPSYIFTCIGSYEYDFIKMLDTFLKFPPDDIMIPSPHTYVYMYEGKEHFYIPDVFIPSLNLEIEIKDGGDNPNKHPKIQAVDKVKEAAKDEVLMSIKNISYLKLYNKDYSEFFEFLLDQKETFKDNEILKEPMRHDIDRYNTDSVEKTIESVVVGDTIYDIPAFAAHLRKLWDECVAESEITLESYFGKKPRHLSLSNYRDYKECKERDRWPVYLTLIDSGSPLGKVIKKATGETWSHSALSFDPTMTNMFSFGADHESKKLTFINEDMSNKFYKAAEDTVRFATFVCFVSSADLKKMKNAVGQFVKHRDEYSYYFMGLIKNFLGIKSTKEKSLFCSQFVGTILNLQKPKLYNKDPSLITPQGLSQTNKMYALDSGFVKLFNAETIEKKMLATLVKKYPIKKSNADTKTKSEEKDK